MDQAAAIILSLKTLNVDIFKKNKQNFREELSVGDVHIKKYLWLCCFCKYVKLKY